MNILFLTLADFSSIKERNIYADLLREFAKRGHNLYIISPVERRKKENTSVLKEDNATILKLRIGNIQKTNIIEKGISTVTVESKFISGIKKYFSEVRFDLVIYSTPPITFCRAIEFVKKRDNAKTYLLLKDIFPQNSLDLGMLKQTGLKGLIYKSFRSKEKRLYEISDVIGCMSEANVDYVIKNNPEIDSSRVEVCPNSIDVVDMSCREAQREEIRQKYNIPSDRKVFVYGGNLGIPQGIDFLIDCLENQKNNSSVFFLIVGDGTEYIKLESYINARKKECTANNSEINAALLKRLPKDDYDRMIGSCDVGMIFLSHKFTIPNFPSRLLAYMQAGLPVLAATDPNTDIGKVITDGGFGWWIESRDVSDFEKKIELICSYDKNKLDDMKKREFECLNDKYSVQKGYEIIMKHFG